MQSGRPVARPRAPATARWRPDSWRCRPPTLGDEFRCILSAEPAKENHVTRPTGTHRLLYLLGGLRFDEHLINPADDGMTCLSRRSSRFCSRRSASRSRSVVSRSTRASAASALAASRSTISRVRRRCVAGPVRCRHAVVFEREAEPLRVRRDRPRPEVDALAGGYFDSAVLHEHIPRCTPPGPIDALRSASTSPTLRRVLSLRSNRYISTSGSSSTSTAVSRIGSATAVWGPESAFG